MINLLSPDLKAAKRYAQYNRTAVKYTVVMVIVMALVILALLWAQMLARSELDELNAELDERQTALTTKSNVTDAAAGFQQRQRIAKQLLAEEHRYTQLLNDLETTLPSGSRITSLSLTGEDTDPFTIQAEVVSRDLAAEIEDAMVASERFTHVDVQSVTDAGGLVEVGIVARFAPGASR